GAGAGAPGDLDPGRCGAGRDQRAVGGGHCYRPAGEGAGDTAVINHSQQALGGRARGDQVALGVHPAAVGQVGSDGHVVTVVPGRVQPGDQSVGDVDPVVDELVLRVRGRDDPGAVGRL